MRATPWFAAVLLLAACAPKPETPEQMAARMKAESDSARVAIETANAHFVRHIAAGRADSAALTYAEDAVYYPANAPAVRGRAAIASALKDMLAAGTWTLAPKTLTVEANSPLAIETGSATMAFVPGPKAPAGMNAAFTDTIKYVTTWRRLAGQWLVSNDISTSDRAAQPAPAKRR